jgi:SAM-dependent methyltransferase
LTSPGCATAARSFSTPGEILDVLRCPGCRQTLCRAGKPAAGVAAAEGIEEGELACRGCGRRFPVREGIPRFVPEDPSDHFGLQWRRFPRTQLDSHSGRPISRDRFLSFSGWNAADLAGRRVLDVGCGAGRFAEVALGFGACVVAVDRSLAVDACRENLGDHPALAVVQADLLALPFAPGSFDFVYCFGVLQHTPDPRRAFQALPPLLAPGGRLVVDVYPRLWQNWLWPKYWLRPLTRRLPPRDLSALVSAAFPFLYPLSLTLGRVPGLGRRLRHLIPVANYEGVYPLEEPQLREWALLDTIDMLGPRHDKPQTAAALRSWLEEAGLVDVSVFRRGFLVGRGRRR